MSKDDRICEWKYLHGDDKYKNGRDTVDMRVEVFDTICACTFPIECMSVRTSDLLEEGRGLSESLLFTVRLYVVAREPIGTRIVGYLCVCGACYLCTHAIICVCLCAHTCVYMVCFMCVLV